MNFNYSQLGSDHSGSPGLDQASPEAPSAGTLLILLSDFSTELFLRMQCVQLSRSIWVDFSSFSCRHPAFLPPAQRRSPAETRCPRIRVVFTVRSDAMMSLSSHSELQQPIRAQSEIPTDPLRANNLK